ACLWFASEISDSWRDVQAARRERWYAQWRGDRRAERLWGGTLIRGIFAAVVFPGIKRPGAGVPPPRRPFRPPPSAHRAPPPPTPAEGPAVPHAPRRLRRPRSTSRTDDRDRSCLQPPCAADRVAGSADLGQEKRALLADPSEGPCEPWRWGLFVGTGWGGFSG